MTSPFCEHARVRERCPQCECELKDRLILALSEKLLILACHLAMLAERKEVRFSVSQPVDTGQRPA